MDKTKLIIPNNKPEDILRPFDITVNKSFLKTLQRAGGWMINIDYKVGDKLTIFVLEKAHG